MVQELLKQLGLSDKEARVYLAVLGQGKATPAEIARVTKINRSTVYNIARELAEKGVIAEDLGGKTRYLLAKPPKDLVGLVAKDKKRIGEKEEIIERAVQELQAFTKDKKYTIPKIVFIGDEDLEDYLYKQSPIWSESILKRDKAATWWGFQDRHFVSHYEGWIDWYWESSAPKEISLKLLSNESAEEIKNKKFPRRKIKFFKGDGEFTGTLWICGSYLIMIVTSKRPHYLVEIYDTILAQNIREVFRGIWERVGEGESL